MDSELSYEMIMEIVSRASTKTLDTMRCTNKELNKLTYESYLLDSCLKRNKMVSGFLIQHRKVGNTFMKSFAPSPESSNLDIGFLPDSAQILATSEHGIMMVHEQDYTRGNGKDVYYICEPATKQLLALPSLKRKYHTIGTFAIVVIGLNPLHYKIIRFCHLRPTRRWNKFYTTYSFEIFDSMTWRWRSLKRVTLRYSFHLMNTQPITMSGSVYMLLADNDILEFDAYSEKWKRFPSPVPAPVPPQENEFGPSKPLLELVKFQGRLGLACKPPNGCWEIWVYKKCDQLWEKTLVYKGDDAHREKLKALCDSDTSVMVNYDTLLFYKIKQELGNKLISEVKLISIELNTLLFSFRSDLGSDFESIGVM